MQPTAEFPPRFHPQPPPAQQTPLFDWRAMAYYQVAGLLFILIYFQDATILAIQHWGGDFFARDYSLAALNVFYGIVFRVNSALDAIFNRVFAFFIISLSIVFFMIIALALHRLRPVLVLRALFGLGFGVLSIPILCALVILVPLLFGWAGSIFGFFSWVMSGIFGWIGWLASILWPFLLALFLLVLAIRSPYSAILLTVLVFTIGGALLIRLVLPELAQPVIEFLLWLGHGLYGIGAAILGFLGWLLGAIFSFIIPIVAFIVSIVVAVFSILLLLVAFCLVNSQFGHLLSDTLLDSRNVMVDARLAGRFLIGVGVLISFLLLGLGSNPQANLAFTEGVHYLVGFFNQSYGLPDAQSFIRGLSAFYLNLIPDRFEPTLTHAFSFGGVPVIDVVLCTLACGLASFWIGREILFDRTLVHQPNKASIAFVPRELFGVLVGVGILIVIMIQATGLIGEG